MGITLCISQEQRPGQSETLGLAWCHSFCKEDEAKETKVLFHNLRVVHGIWKLASAQWNYPLIRLHSTDWIVFGTYSEKWLTR